MLFFRRTSLLVALAGALVLTACDVGTPETPTASVTVDLRTVQAQRNCDPPDNRSEYQIQVAVWDPDNRMIARVTLPEGTTYGEWPGTDSANYIWLDTGESTSVGERLSFDRPLDPSGSFSLHMSVIEWDANGTRDDLMNGRTSIAEHAYHSGGFENTTGDQSLRVGAARACEVSLRYTVSVR